MGLLAIVYCIGLFTNFSIYGIPNKYSLTLFKGWSICCATGGQLRALRGVNLKRDEGVSLSVFSTQKKQLKDKELEGTEKTKSTNTKSHKERLLEINELFEDGLLTKNEYESMREMILNEI
jgi:hypothetical protein